MLLSEDGCREGQTAGVHCEGTRRERQTRTEHGSVGRGGPSCPCVPTARPLVPLAGDGGEDNAHP